MGNPNLKEAAQLAEKQVIKVARESAEKIIRGRACQSCKASSCYSSCPTFMISSGHRAVFKYLAGTKPPDNNVKEALPPGVPIFKGGSKNKSKRKKKIVGDFASRYMGL